MAKKKTPIEKFLSRSDAGKDAAVADLENGINWSKTRPLNAAERKPWDGLKRKLRAGRPRVGAGAKLVAVTIERNLLARADRYAKGHGLKRTEMIAKGLELVMRTP